MNNKKITFITGTDTGVGKTVFTALLLHHLRKGGVHALAMKPFCSGGRGDVELLQSLQKGELTDAEMNPFYFDQPVAPYAAKAKKRVRLPDVRKKITHCAEKCDHLLIEGSGGLLVPLGKGFTVADVIANLDCEVIVVGRNRLGTINHTLLTVKQLQVSQKPKAISVVLMGQKVKDASAATNLSVLKRLLPGIRVSEVPFLGVRIASRKQILTKISTVETILEDLVNPIVKKK